MGLHGLIGRVVLHKCVLSARTLWDWMRPRRRASRFLRGFQQTRACRHDKNLIYWCLHTRLCGNTWDTSHKQTSTKVLVDGRNR
jgi:hypothetical protein